MRKKLCEKKSSLLLKQVSERKEQSEQLMQAVLREAFEGKPTISDNKPREVNNA